MWRIHGIQPCEASYTSFIHHWLNRLHWPINDCRWDGVVFFMFIVLLTTFTGNCRIFTPFTHQINGVIETFCADRIEHKHEHNRYTGKIAWLIGQYAYRRDLRAQLHLMFMFLSLRHLIGPLNSFGKSNDRAKLLKNGPECPNKK